MHQFFSCPYLVSIRVRTGGVYAGPHAAAHSARKKDVPPPLARGHPPPPPPRPPLPLSPSTSTSTSASLPHFLHLSLPSLSLPPSLSLAQQEQQHQRRNDKKSSTRFSRKPPCLRLVSARGQGIICGPEFERCQRSPAKQTRMRAGGSSNHEVLQQIVGCDARWRQQRIMGYDEAGRCVNTSR